MTSSSIALLSPPPEPRPVNLTHCWHPCPPWVGHYVAVRDIKTRLSRHALRCIMENGGTQQTQTVRQRTARRGIGNVPLHVSGTTPPKPPKVRLALKRNHTQSRTHMNDTIQPQPSPTPAPPHIHIHTAKPRRFGWILAVTLLVAALGVSMLMNLGIFAGSAILASSRLERLSFQQYGIEFSVKYLGGGEDSDAVLVIPVGGIIHGSLRTGNMEDPASRIEAQLAIAAQETSIKGVLLYINSPGGEVTAADVIHNLIREFRDDTGKPVVAVMASVAASGGYYIAAACSHIIAHPLTTTGSIGVIMTTFNATGLMDKAGVQAEVFKSGSSKDLGSPWRTVSEEERALVQHLIDESFQRFVEVVLAGRNLQRSDLEAANVLDGRVISGTAALEHQLVDELGTIQTGLDWLGDHLVNEDLAWIKLSPVRNPLRQFLGVAEQLGQNGLAISLPNEWDFTGKLQPGSLYYLAPITAGM
ncbi:MAG: signal peptide peptidase SppA [Verrucomicrobiota bacterium]